MLDSKISCLKGYCRTEYYRASSDILHLLTIRDIHPHTLESWHNLIELYEAWNKPEKANEWRAKLPKSEVVEK